jgi:hypothetical protein
MTLVRSSNVDTGTRVFSIWLFTVSTLAVWIAAAHCALSNKAQPLQQLEQWLLQFNDVK